MWRVILSNAAESQFEKLDKAMQRRAASRIDDLRQSSHPRGAKALKGRKDEYRLRAGSYRILYAVNASTRTIAITEIVKRDESTYR